MLNHTPVVFILVVGGLLLSARLWMRLLPSSRPLGNPGSNRFSTIDGMRGLAAASVFAGHTVSSLGYVKTGLWEYGSYPLYLWATEGAVAVFFMITGFLFWDKALKGGINLRSHLRSRIRRLYPVYILSSILIFLLAAWFSGFELRVPLPELLATVAAWAAGGLIRVPQINGQGVLFLNANVLWTLQYEWVFYLLLPLLAVLFRRRTSLMAALYAAAIAAVTVLHLGQARSQLLVGLPLLCGCLTAAWLRGGRYVPDLNSRGATAIAAGLLVLSMLCFRPGLATADILLLIWPLFSMVAGGCNPLGCLTRPGMIFVGKVSYGIYMMHGIMLCFIQRAWGGFEAGHPVAFLALSPVVIFIFTGWCLLVFRKVEEPCIAGTPRIGLYGAPLNAP